MERRRPKRDGASFCRFYRFLTTAAMMSSAADCFSGGSVRSIAQICSEAAPQSTGRMSARR